MQIHTLKSRNIKKAKRIGRGGKRGTYSGRGVKGQKARSGVSIDPLFEGGRSSLVERLKKKKGFTSPHLKKNTVSLAKLESAYADGETVDMKTLVEKGLVDKARVKRGVKILASGEITKKLIVSEGVLLSDTAKRAIEKVGGTVSNTEGYAVESKQ